MDHFNTVINIQYTDEAIREVCLLYACSAAGDEATENPTVMQYVDNVKVALYNSRSLYK